MEQHRDITGPAGLQVRTSWLAGRLTTLLLSTSGGAFGFVAFLE